MNRILAATFATLWLSGIAGEAAAKAQNGAAAEDRPASVERLVELVAAGQDLRTSEFREVVSADGAERFLRAAECEASPPRYNSDRSSAMIVWDCTGRPDRSSAGAMLQLDQGEITNVEVMSAVMIPAGRQ